MIKLLIWLAGAGALAAAFDMIGRRVLARGECGLHRALILRDSCLGRCPPGQRCAAMETRPYWLGGRQAAACGCQAGRKDPRRLDDPDQGALPRPDPEGAPERPKTPETTDRD